ncbi:MAG: hypothetical protein HQK72_17680 [Desulfamplus sp.]|nr:hypothetical protein [Desulfamplus sp.]
MLSDIIIFLVGYIIGGVTLLLFIRGKRRKKLNEAIARASIVTTQVQSFTSKIGNGTEAAISKFSELILSINNSIKNTTKVVDTIRAKMSVCVSKTGEQNSDKADLKEIQKRYGFMLQEVMEQLDLIIQRKKEDIEKLDHIKQSADKIKPFSTEIASIAYNTKIISMNAAIEASRAGKAGRTFEVVAAEVRHLAQRSTTSAEQMEKQLSQITDFIDNTTIELKEAIDVESRFINSTVILLQDVVMSVVESFISISEAVEKTLGDSSTFRDEVNSIVFNLQFEDICNQMSQHTVEILDNIKKDLESLKIGKDTEAEKNKHTSIKEKIFNSAKSLFTMEDERELAKESLGIKEDKGKNISKKAEKPKEKNISKEAQNHKEKEFKATEKTTATTIKKEESKQDDDVTFFDEPEPASDKSDDDDVTFFDEPASDKSDDDGVTFFDEPVSDKSDDDDVTFFDEPASDKSDDDDVTFFYDNNRKGEDFDNGDK